MDLRAKNRNKQFNLELNGNSPPFKCVISPLHMGLFLLRKQRKHNKAQLVTYSSIGQAVSINHLFETKKEKERNSNFFVQITLNLSNNQY